MFSVRHIVFCTFGSLGDLYPYVAIAERMKADGFRVSIATNNDHKSLIECSGIGFIHVRPDVAALVSADPDIMHKAMDSRKGSEYIIRNVVFANLRNSFEDLYSATEGVDLLVTHPLTYAAILVARKRELPRLSTVLAPINFWSKSDPPAPPKAEWLPEMSKLVGPQITGTFMDIIKAQTYSWSEPYRQLQAELGLEIDKRNPIFEGQFSASKNLALFSPVFAEPQVDWPPNTVATGFPFIPEFEPGTFNPQVQAFLESGSPPIVFTLGTSAVFDAGSFYIDSIEALRLLNMRGVLLTGPVQDPRLTAALQPHVIAVEYLPHSYIFPRSVAIVHQGGIGTTAQALRSGKPQLVMPFSHDQFDNANRVTSLGCGLTVRRNRYNAALGMELLRKLCSEPYQSAAGSVGLQIATERGAENAAREIAAVLA